MPDQQRRAAANKWNARRLTSLCTLSTFLLMSISGLVLYVVPHSRVAGWLDWTFLGLSRYAWRDIHVISSIAFVVVAGFHIYFNWIPLLRYLRGGGRGAVRSMKELTLTLALTVLLVVSGAAGLPPLSYLPRLSQWIKNAWVRTDADEPPFSRAEDLSLAAFCERRHIPLDEAIAALQAAGLRNVSGERGLLELARANNTTPAVIYGHLKPLEQAGPRGRGRGLGPGNSGNVPRWGPGWGQGKGLGPGGGQGRRRTEARGWQTSP